MTRGDKVDNVRRISVQGRLNQDRQVETGSFSSPSRLSASSALSLLPASVPNRLAIGAEDVRHGCNCKTHEESFRYQPAPVLVQPSPRLFPCHLLVSVGPYLTKSPGSSASCRLSSFVHPLRVSVTHLPSALATRSPGRFPPFPLRGECNETRYDRNGKTITNQGRMT